MGVDITLSLMGLDPLKKMSFEKKNLFWLRRSFMLLATLNITNDYENYIHQSQSTPINQ